MLGTVRRLINTRVQSSGICISGSVQPLGIGIYTHTHTHTHTEGETPVNRLCFIPAGVPLTHVCVRVCVCVCVCVYLFDSHGSRYGSCSHPVHTQF